MPITVEDLNTYFLTPGPSAWLARLLFHSSRVRIAFSGWRWGSGSEITGELTAYHYPETGFGPIVAQEMWIPPGWVGPEMQWIAQESTRRLRLGRVQISEELNRMGFQEDVGREQGDTMSGMAGSSGVSVSNYFGEALGGVQSLTGLGAQNQQGRLGDGTLALVSVGQIVAYSYAPIAWSQTEFSAPPPPEPPPAPLEFSVRRRIVLVGEEAGGPPKT